MKTLEAGNTKNNVALIAVVGAPQKCMFTLYIPTQANTKQICTNINPQRDISRGGSINPTGTKAARPLMTRGSPGKNACGRTESYPRLAMFRKCKLSHCVQETTKISNRLVASGSLMTIEALSFFIRNPRFDNTPSVKHISLENTANFITFLTSGSSMEKISSRAYPIRCEPKR